MFSRKTIFICLGIFIASYFLLSCGSPPPQSDMVTDHYEILGTGPNDGHAENTISRITKNIDPMTPPASEQFDNLSSGEWTVTVNAKNAADETIGTGTKWVIVNPSSIGGEATEVTVIVAPIPGTGNLNIAVSWNGDLTFEPELHAMLTGPDWGTIPLIAVVHPDGSGGTISNMVDGVVMIPVANGYYTLTVTLTEPDDYLVAGFADTVRIVDGQNTTGAIDWGELINPI